MMIVTHSRSTVIIVICNTCLTQLTNWLTKQLTKWEPVDEGQRKRAHVGACTLSARRTALYFSRSKVIIAPDLHKRKGKEKELLLSHQFFRPRERSTEGLTLPQPLYFGRVSPRYACEAEARADHDSPPFRLFPNSGRCTPAGGLKSLLGPRHPASRSSACKALFGGGHPRRLVGQGLTASPFTNPG